MRVQGPALPPQAAQLALAPAPPGRLAVPQGPELAPDLRPLESRRQLAAPGVQERALQQQSTELQVRAPELLARLPPAGGPGPAPEWWLPGLHRQLAASGVLERALQRHSPEGPARGPQQQLPELRVQVRALRLAGAAGQEQVQVLAVWQPGWLLPPAEEGQARAPQ